MDLPRHLPLANPVLAPPGAGFIPPLSGGAEVEQRRAELTRAQQNLHAAQLKIQALTLELAHHKRLRFGQKSEALAVNQGDLFAETALIDQAAIEAELDRLANQLNPAPRRPPRVRPGSAPAVSPYPTISPASNTGTNPSPANAGSAVRT